MTHSLPTNAPHRHSRDTGNRASRSAPAKPPYDRTAQLPKLIGLWPRELADVSEAGTARVVAMLRKALRGERQRGIAGHWTYDLNRHLALIEALREERARLKIIARVTAVRQAMPREPRRGGAEVLHLPTGRLTPAQDGGGNT
jgi:hypothetical protein